MDPTEASLTDRVLRRLFFWRKRNDPGDYGIKGCFTLPDPDPGPALDRRQPSGGPDAA